jgi:ribosomal protein L16 Arg81 hydroxylase
MPPSAPGEIPDASIAAAVEQLQACVAALSASPDWFGELVTEPLEDATVPAQGRLPAAVVQDPAARIAWRRDKAALVVYANGDALRTEADSTMLERLCSNQVIDAGRAQAAELALLQELWQRGCLLDA